MHQTALTSQLYNTRLEFAVGDGPDSVAIGDLDENGAPDLAVANGSSDDVSVLINISVRVSSVNPMNGQTRVNVNTPITATFSENMDASTLNTDTFLLNDGTNNFAGTVSCVGETATFTPTTALSYSTTYTVTITTQAKDPAVNPLQSEHTWTFTTQADTSSGGSGGSSGGCFISTGSAPYAASLSIILFICLGVFIFFVPSFLPELQPDGYVVEPKMFPQLIEHEPFIGKMDFVGFVRKDHKGGRPDTGLGGIKKLETP